MLGNSSVCVCGGVVDGLGKSSLQTLLMQVNDLAWQRLLNKANC